MGNDTPQYSEAAYRAAVDEQREERAAAIRDAERRGAERMRDRLLARAADERAMATHLAQSLGERSASVVRFEYAATVLEDIAALDVDAVLREEP
jgi:hypothetical protein